MDAEFLTVNRIHWLRLFRCTRNSRSELLTVEDNRAFAARPDPVKIYRGAPEKFARGTSSTTDEVKARWLAEPLEPKGKVFTIVLPKNKFLVHFLGRDEAEAFIHLRRICYEVALRSGGRAALDNRLRLANLPPAQRRGTVRDGWGSHTGH
jgi:hypothetical protein